MSRRIYREILTEENMSTMKASEIRDLNEIEDTLVKSSVFLMLLSFVEASTLVALLIWTSKITLFLSLVGFLAILPITILLIVQMIEYKKMIDKYSNQENTSP